MSKSLKSKFSFGQSEDIETVDFFGRTAKKKQKKKVSVGRAVGDFVGALLVATVRNNQRERGELTGVAPSAQATVIGENSAAEGQPQNVRGGSERGNLKKKTKAEILDPYDGFRALGSDDLLAQAKVVVQLIDKQEERKGAKLTLREKNNIRRRVGRAVELYRSDEITSLKKQYQFE
jgi:hypothetical protein